MLIFKRIVTASISFLILFFVLYFGTLVIGGGIVGGIAGVKNPENAKQVGEQAGEQFAQKYIGVIAISSVALSGLSSGVLVFGGILPWCRKKQHDEAKNNNV